MTSVDILNPSGSKSGSIELPAEIFDVTTNVPLIHQVVVAQLAAARQGTHATKTRGMVRGGSVVMVMIISSLSGQGGSSDRLSGTARTRWIPPAPWSSWSG